MKNQINLQRDILMKYKKDYEEYAELINTTIEKQNSIKTFDIDFKE